MSNRKRLTTFKIQNVWNEGMAKKLPRGERRAMRQNRLVATIVMDHHRPHELRDDCGPSCEVFR